MSHLHVNVPLLDVRREKRGSTVRWNTPGQEDTSPSVCV